MYVMEGYATNFFEMNKKGLFIRRKVRSAGYSRAAVLKCEQIPLREMITWTKTPIASPLLKHNKESHVREAVNCFKIIAAYMGDRASTEEPMSLATELVQKAVSIPG